MPTDTHLPLPADDDGAPASGVYRATYVGEERRHEPGPASVAVQVGETVHNGLGRTLGPMSQLTFAGVVLVVFLWNQSDQRDRDAFNQQQQQTWLKQVADDRKEAEARARDDREFYRAELSRDREHDSREREATRTTMLTAMKAADDRTASVVAEMRTVAAEFRAARAAVVGSPKPVEDQ